MAKSNQLTWIEAILKVLEGTKNPMHYTKIWDVIRDRHYKNSDEHSNPEIIVNVNIQQNKDKIIPFGDKGCYILKKHMDVYIKNYLEKNTSPQQSVIRAYGVMWSKSKFIQNNYKLHGKLANIKKTSKVDLSEERGIYVLYDGYNIVYIGQSINPLASRLKSHTKTGKQWDSFSWYGIDEVQAGGQVLKEKVFSITAKALIDAFEAVMILATQPCHNKTRGNHVRGQEYQQI